MVGFVVLATLATAARAGVVAHEERQSRPADAFIELDWQSLSAVPVPEDNQSAEVLGRAGRWIVILQENNARLLDSDTGAVAAKIDLGSSPAVVAAGYLVVLDGKALVGYAASAGSFQREWQVPIDPTKLVPYGTRLFSAEAGRTVLLTGAGCGDLCPNVSHLGHPPEMVGIDVTTGTVRWRHLSNGPEIDTLAAASGRFVVASRGEAMAYAADTGRLIWRTGRQSSDSDDKSVLAIDGEDVLFAPGGRKLARLALATGGKRWEVSLAGLAVTSLAASGGTVFLSLRESLESARPRPNAVRALNIVHGGRLWQRPFNATRVVLGGEQTLIVEEMGAGARTRLLLVDRANGEVRDAFRIGRGAGALVERPAIGRPRLAVGSSVGVLGLGLGERPSSPAAREISGRVTAAAGGPLSSFAVDYEARGPGWPIRATTTDAQGQFKITVDASDVVPIWLSPEGVRRYRRENRIDPRWNCMARPPVHYVFGSRATASERLDTGLICFEPDDE